ncbi:MAG: aminopeptidase, partial [Lachnospiraceae bacterium]|nr:aminopeptidase [Lachnospiraceae bacterium]
MKTVFYDDLLENGYVGTEAVGRGSECKSCVFIAEYNPQHTDTVDVALVGKGITFDSGGYSLKSADGMLLMKSDMGGAATAVAALGLMILRGLPYHVKLVICCAENMVSGSSYKPGDHLEYPNGVTVEVLNTDAEGRLILADGLIEAQKSKPELLIDVATLTGAAKVALGRDYNAALSFDEKLSFLFKKSAEQEHERAWPLPLDRFHCNLVKGVNTDIVNSVSAEGTAGASTAAAFLSYFVNEGQQWLHIDLGASFQKCANQFYAPGAKGHGFRS